MNRNPIWKLVDEDYLNGLSTTEILEKHNITYEQLKYARRQKYTIQNGRISTVNMDTIIQRILNITEDDYKSLLEQYGTVISHWCRHFGVTTGHLRYRNAIKSLFTKFDTPREQNPTQYKNYNLVDLALAVKENTSWSSVCISLGISVCTFNFKRLQSLCEDNNISTEHWKTSSKQHNAPKWTKETVLVKDCTIHRSGLRPVLLRLGMYPGKCDECGIPDVWNGKPLIIEIDHINGDHRDNTIENLRWLCPNCHSQTDTYRRSSNNKADV